ncbi:MAG: HAD hydrolase-like protein [Promethearchaeia archaeon]
MDNHRLGFSFDFDGTLVNSIDIVDKVQDAIFEKYDIERTKELDKKIEEKINEILQGENRKNIGRSIMISIFKLLGLNFFQRIRALLFARKIFKREAPNISLIDGVQEVFQFLEERNYPFTIITTSSNAEVADRLEEKYPEFYAKVKDKTIGRDDVKNMKPHRESICKAADCMDVPVEHIVMVGDMKADIELGQTVGALTIGVLTGFLNEKRFEDMGADFILPSVARIPKVMDEIIVKLTEV